MASIFSKVKTWVVSEWKALEPEEEAALAELETKITPDAMALMEDAVEAAYIQGLTGDAARAAAIAKFKTDGIKTIKDVESWAVSEYNVLVELVYSIVQKKLTTLTKASPATKGGMFNADGTSIG